MAVNTLSRGLKRYLAKDVIQKPFRRCRKTRRRGWRRQKWTSSVLNRSRRRCTTASTISLMCMLLVKKDFTRKKRKGGKLDSKWVGPYKIAKALGKGLYRLEDVSNPSNVICRVNGIHLNPYNQPSMVWYTSNSLYQCDLILCISFITAAGKWPRFWSWDEWKRYIGTECSGMYSIYR